jgi:hypothetical protein
MTDYFDKIYQSTELAKTSSPNSINNEQMFIDGWHQGVLEFWNHVKEKL